MLEQLKKTRKNSGLTLSQVSDKLKISERYLAAIEEKNYPELPERVYAIGFIKIYASFLNLDYSEMLLQFRNESSCLIGEISAQNGDHYYCPQRSELSKMVAQKMLSFGGRGAIGIKLIIAVVIALIITLFMELM